MASINTAVLQFPRIRNQLGFHRQKQGAKQVHSHWEAWHIDLLLSTGFISMPLSNCGICFPDGCKRRFHFELLGAKGSPWQVFITAYQLATSRPAGES